MDSRGNSLGTGDNVKELCSTTPRNLRDANYQIDKGLESANSFPRHKSHYGTNTGFSLKEKNNLADDRGSKCLEELQNIPSSDEPAPLPPRRITSLMGPGGASTLTLRHSKPQECASTLNPKRISIATSTFWLGNPDMEKFANALDFGHETMKTQSVWGASDQGSGGTECVDIWGDPPAVKKGVLMQQREKLWSRWKERYIILTRDYLNCFRRSSNVHRSGVTLSEMGSFIFKLRLADVEEIRWENRRSGSLVTLVLPQEPRILLRVPNDNTEALHQWYTLLQECIYMSKERRQALRNNHMCTYKSCSTLKSHSGHSTTESPKLFSKCKSNSSSSPHTSSDDEGVKPDVDDLYPDHDMVSRGTLSSQPGKYSNVPSTRNSYAGRNYSSKVSEDEVGHDDDDYADTLEESEGVYDKNRSYDKQSNELVEADDYKPVPLRRAPIPAPRNLLNRAQSRSGTNLTLNDIVRNSWDKSQDGYTHRSNAEISGENGSSCNQSRKLSSGYAIPADSLLRPQSKRPESWTPQSNLFYRTPSLIPSQWINKRELPLARTAGPPFGRSTMIVCPSRLTAEVTYIRRM